MNISERRLKRDSTFKAENSLNIKNFFGPQIQLVSKIRDSKNPKKIKSFYNQSSNKDKRLTAEIMVGKVNYLLDRCYLDKNCIFVIKFKNYLKIGWITHRAKINDRLNKISYITPSIKYKEFQILEIQLFRQWKKNPVLREFKSCWFHFIKQFSFKNIHDFIEHYKILRQFLSQVTYMLYRESFEVLEKKNFPILDRIFAQTSHSIITEDIEWQQIYKSQIFPFLKVNNQINYKFDLKQFQNNPKIFDIENKQMQLPRTLDKINKFIKEIKLMDKIQLLKKIHQTFSEEVTSWQNKLIESKKLNGLQMIQKDDILDGLIYCIIRGQVHGLPQAISYLNTILGEQIEDILNRSGVSSYYIDLKSSLDYLNEIIIKSNILI